MIYKCFVEFPLKTPRFVSFVFETIINALCQDLRRKRCIMAARKSKAKSVSRHSKKAKIPRKAPHKAAVSHSHSPSSKPMVALCGLCGSTRIEKSEGVDTCADCRSTQMLAVHHGEVQATQNRLFEHHVERKFQEYMEQKNQRHANMHFARLVLVLVVIILVVLLAVNFAGGL